MISKASVIWVGLFCLIWSGPVPVAAEVKTSIAYEYYDVTPGPDGSLADSIFSSTPIFHSEGKFAGQSKYTIRYNYSYSRPTIGICRVTTVEVTCHCPITLPRLKGGNAVIKRNFENYLLRLDEHERRHCDIAIEHANLIEARLKAVKSAKCGELAAEFKARYDRIYEECRSAQARYDHETRHGLYEGADIAKFDARYKRDLEPGPASSGVGLKNLDKPDDSAFYQDADGVWRNY